jgi:hypothetical protein
MINVQTGFHWQRRRRINNVSNACDTWAAHSSSTPSTATHRAYERTLLERTHRTVVYRIKKYVCEILRLCLLCAAHTVDVSARRALLDIGRFVADKWRVTKIAAHGIITGYAGVSVTIVLPIHNCCRM